MNRRSILFFTLVLAAGLSACGGDETSTEPPVYTDNDSPEAVLANLITAYRSQEIEEYLDLLDPQFRFYFQDGDEPAELGRGYWTAAEDSAATHGLFAAEQITDVYVDLTYGNALTGTVARSPDPFMWIRATPVKLTLDDRDGTTYLVTGDIQDFFFREGAGENSGRWYLYEWHDVSGGAGIGAPGHGVLPAAVEPSSWGSIKSWFWDGVVREES